MGILGQRHYLGSDKEEAERTFHELMAQLVEKPQRSDTSIPAILSNTRLHVKHSPISPLANSSNARTPA
jgi:hypothetical protein